MTFMAKSKECSSFIEFIASAYSFLSLFFALAPNAPHRVEAAFQVNAHRAGRYAVLSRNLLVTQTTKKEVRNDFAERRLEFRKRTTSAIAALARSNDDGENVPFH